MKTGGCNLFIIFQIRYVGKNVPNKSTVNFKPSPYYKSI